MVPQGPQATHFRPVLTGTPGKQVRATAGLLQMAESPTQANTWFGLNFLSGAVLVCSSSYQDIRRSGSGPFWTIEVAVWMAASGLHHSVLGGALGHSQALLFALAVCDHGQC